MAGAVCIMPQCFNQSNGKGDSGGFFCLPANLKIRKQWIDASGLSQKYMEKGNFRICWRHFQRCDIRTDLKRLKLTTGINCYNSMLESNIHDN